METTVESFAARFPGLAGRLKPASEVRGDEHRVEERLTRRFGLGQEPGSRRQLYRWLANLANQHGEPILEAISEACGASDGAKNPDRYFCSVVVRLLKKMGHGRLTGGNRQW